MSANIEATPVSVPATRSGEVKLAGQYLPTGAPMGSAGLVTVTPIALVTDTSKVITAPGAIVRNEVTPIPSGAVIAPSAAPRTAPSVGGGAEAQPAPAPGPVLAVVKPDAWSAPLQALVVLGAAWLLHKLFIGGKG